MPIGEILGFVLVAVGIGTIARAGYIVLGGRRSGNRLPAQDQELLEEMQERLAETEERLDSAEQALRRQSERPRLPPEQDLRKRSTAHHEPPTRDYGVHQ